MIQKCYPADKNPWKGVYKWKYSLLKKEVSRKKVNLEECMVQKRPQKNGYFKKCIRNKNVYAVIRKCFLMIERQKRLGIIKKESKKTWTWTKNEARMGNLNEKLVTRNLKKSHSETVKIHLPKKVHPFR